MPVVVVRAAGHDRACTQIAVRADRAEVAPVDGGPGAAAGAFFCELIVPVAPGAAQVSASGAWCGTGVDG